MKSITWFLTLGILAVAGESAMAAGDLKAGAAAVVLQADDCHGDRRRHRPREGEGSGGRAAAARSSSRMRTAGRSLWSRATS